MRWCCTTAGVQRWREHSPYIPILLWACKHPCGDILEQYTNSSSKPFTAVSTTFRFGTPVVGLRFSMSRRGLLSGHIVQGGSRPPLCTCSGDRWPRWSIIIARGSYKPRILYTYAACYTINTTIDSTCCSFNAKGLIFRMVILFSKGIKLPRARG